MRDVIHGMEGRYGREGLAWRAGLTACCVIGLFLPRCCIGGEAWWLYWMSHANVFHLACNLWCLWAIRIPLRWVGALALCVICGCLPCPVWDWGEMGFVEMETCGLSGFLLCALAMAWGEAGELKKMIRYLVLPVMAFSLLPGVNLVLHAWCMAGGAMVGLLRGTFRGLKRT